MNILVITDRIGGSASGIVFENILKELCEFNTFDIITYTCSLSKNSKGINSIRILPSSLNHTRLDFYIKLYNWKFFKTCIIDELNKFRIGLKNRKYDLVLGFCSNGGYLGLIGGIHAKKKLGIKLACYFTDPIPAPKEWYSNQKLRNHVLSFITKRISDIDFLASSNPKMLSYQLGFFKDRERCKSDVLFTPCKLDSLTYIPKCNDGIIRFVYTGAIYGIRNPGPLLNAFAQLCREYNNVELLFIGKCSLNEYLKDFPLEFQTKIKFIAWVKDLSIYYQKASALIDIDADVENDVFLSSKIINYLPINRPIISITGKDSVSRKIFAGNKTIYQCSHDVTAIFRVLKNIVEQQATYDYTERLPLLEQFSSKTIATKLQQNLVKLLNEKYFL